MDSVTKKKTQNTKIKEDMKLRKGGVTFGGAEEECGWIGSRLIEHMSEILKELIGKVYRNTII